MTSLGKLILLASIFLLLLQNALASNVQIRVLNAKNGKPVANEKVSVQVKGVRDATEYRTDVEGNVNADLDPAAQVFAATEWWITCRKIGKGINPYISVGKIMQEGAVTENTCGRAKSETIKGRLIIFARKGSLIEHFQR
ncbi:MAG TPA: hypothetical protein VGG80_01815 [Acidobacteriaceae bacterium]|jgi:hypothetical protein